MGLKAASRGACLGETWAPGNLEGQQGAWPGPFAETKTDTQGSLRYAQSLLANTGSWLYHHAVPAGGAAARAAPGGGIGRQQRAAERKP